MVLARVPSLEARFESPVVIGLGLVVTAAGLWLLRGSAVRPGPDPSPSVTRPGAVLHP